MSFRFKPDEPIGKAVRRIAKGQVDGALEALARPKDAHAAIHKARTAIKRLRGLLRLIRPTLPQRVFRKEDRELRDLGRALSELRDAGVLVRTFEKLGQHLAGPLGPGLRRTQLRITRRRRKIEQRLDLGARLRAASRAFGKLHRRLRHWDPRHAKRDAGFGAIGPGLCEIYEDARAGMRAAGRTGDAEIFHEWRKAVKYHGHHLRLLGDLRPDEMQTRADETDKLGDLLGEDHDLSVLAETLGTELRSFDNQRDRDRLLAAIATRQKQLRQEALPIGARLFAQTGSRFRRVVRHDWKGYRTDGPPASGKGV